ncbi:glycolate oxidase subunit GlcF [Candidatus Methylomicrobium oryzae]|uniref:glycolate oxidase subunit GlcF n=1 Tax=Candidatus Methylomicrobium oryzae TaxID=2802053 RepID=UPI0019238E57|nr:glycolate oxidase subunit GlcF [Methylomicrobium sp. RS1]MBL1264593.1 glycolate oxidase subunit GlcF [Methylomicrobium sp. RS1]
MYTRLDDQIEASRRSELEAILRSCVHCGFCNATCPTYRLLGDELDGPRGRIYLIKQVLEGQAATRLTQEHLDRCLTCRACETTCPSGVQYGRLLDTGREIVDRQAGRSFWDRGIRSAIVRTFPYRRRFAFVLKVARRLGPLLSEAVRRKIPTVPPQPQPAQWPEPRHHRKMLIYPGCVQPALAPAIDLAAAKVLDRLGISLLQAKIGSCCGALPYHLSAQERALALARRNIDVWEPYRRQGIEPIVSTASGCGVMMKDYGRLLKNDPRYAEKAARFSAAVRDIAEVVAGEELSVFRADGRRIAFQSPCTLQHGQRLNGMVEAILQKIGYRLAPVGDAHLCCGSAGVYSLLQPDLAAKLRDNKLQALQAGQPDLIVTANIGCLTHLQTGARQKVVHWIELLQ